MQELSSTIGVSHSVLYQPDSTQVPQTQGPRTISVCVASWCTFSPNSLHVWGTVLRGNLLEPILPAGNGNNWYREASPPAPSPLTETALRVLFTLSQFPAPRSQSHPPQHCACLPSCPCLTSPLTVSLVTPTDECVPHLRTRFWESPHKALAEYKRPN